jgi:2-polyprenyl-6-methoxyphenol hydroxylase-like FAD-dependent oxidoreductase
MAELKVDVPRDSVLLWGGPGYHVVHYPLRHGTEFNIVAVFRTATHAEKADTATYRAELEHIYRDAHPSMRALNAMMDFRWRRSVADRNPVRHWHKGRVVLIGDAAHAPLQSLAQGACMAIEDGLCLGELIHAANDDFSASVLPLRGSSAHADGSRATRIARHLGLATSCRGHCPRSSQYDCSQLGRGTHVRLPVMALRGSSHADDSSQ